MSASLLTTTCQVCGAEESLDNLIARMVDDDQVRRLIGSLLVQSFSLGGLVVRYLRLHKPPKQKLRMDKLAKLLGELVPDIQRTAIERNGRTWAVGPDAWKAALQAVFEAQEKGTLSLPLDGNGYLYATLMRMADRTEAAQERESEAGRKHGSTNATVTVKGQPMAIGDALGKVFPTQDPELAKLDRDNKRAAPMPAAIREQIAAIRKRVPIPTKDLPTEEGN
ncbi:hypothetical protein [Rhodoferax aquaticus]|uniref:Uncharacterized protein n=1 Tax=Rhodoferax aquaticus TaxID=2527691 RepID=A0A515EKC8_9BURK|nr:hypothetical protein [Rhodoferax aquaticus]QDL53125.1 hypothetical protein EXZ61_02480 [Rhodoferax aquaticus]